MRDSWRAGFSYDQRTGLVMTGIYRLSRNPAFLGFDLLYIGCAAVPSNREPVPMRFKGTSCTD